MRKSKKYNSKKTNKFSRKNKKQKGGMTEDNNYILVGFMYIAFYSRDNERIRNTTPIFLHKNKNNVDDLFSDKTISGPIYYGYPGPYNNLDYSQTNIILSQLYKTKYRNLEFKGFLLPGLVLVYEDETPIITDMKIDINQIYNRWWSTIHSGHSGYGYDVEFNKNIYIDKHKEEIKQMELKFPGLFQRIFITEEEEKQSLEELERKEIEISNSNFKSKTILPDEKDERKQEEMEFMEFTNRITPFLRDDLKNNRKNKISRKKIKDTNITIGSVY